MRLSITQNTPTTPCWRTPLRHTSDLFDIHHFKMEMVAELCEASVPSLEVEAIGAREQRNQTMKTHMPPELWRADTEQWLCEFFRVVGVQSKVHDCPNNSW